MARHKLIPIILTLFACGPVEDVTDSTATVVGGDRTYDRPEIGTTGGCTATLIRPNIAITAAHCWGYRSRESQGSYGRIRFDFGPNDSQRFNISKYKSFGSSLGTRDVTLLLLDTSVPINMVTPASLATEEPQQGVSSVIWGYGCTNQSSHRGGGVKRNVETTYGRTDNLCPGDSGGPATVGHDGPIWGINSSYGSRDGFGRPYRLIDEINDKIVEWGGDQVPPGIDPNDDTAPPTVEVLSPLHAEARQEHTTVLVSARITDDLRLSRSTLIWDYNGNSYGCPTNETYVDCEIDGDVYNWKVKVSTGQRTFRVQAVDIVGKRTVSTDHTIYLTPNGMLPPELTDFDAPVISLLSPQNDLQVSTQTNVDIVVQVTDDSALDELVLVWDYNGKSYSCPHSSQYVDCSVNGDQYTWTVLAVSESNREYRIRAKDAAGHSSVSETRKIIVKDIPDEQAPTIEILTPQESDRLSAESEIEVTVRATDNMALDSVELDWSWYNGDVYGCPHRSRYVQCTIAGDEYRWRVTVSTGERRFKVIAQDRAGNETISPERIYVLEGR